MPEFKLEIPLDASGIDGFEQEAVKVMVRDRRGQVHSQTVELGRDGKAVAKLSFKEHPAALKVSVGPKDASEEEMAGLQTIDRSVSSRVLFGRDSYRLSPIQIPAFYWFRWRRWCRTFIIRGVVRCPDGSPVPGAKVCAYDVDWWWWWSGEQQVGCTVTDANGAFSIKFRWCCGWWPIWWWRQRAWRLEPVLIERILPILKRIPTLPEIPKPAPKPDLSLFERLIEGDDLPIRVGRTVDPGAFEGLQKRLLLKLPKAPELEQLRIWPWWPFRPWWDCNPDIIFRVTQNCEGQETQIVDENIFQARWNIPTTSEVTLVAQGNACCVDDEEEPEGDCLVIDSACDDLVATIGGNPPVAPGVAAPTDGYRNPGTGDRPYGGNISISGRFGDGASADYYEFEYSDDDGMSWNSMPPAAAGDIRRWYWGPKLGTADPPTWHPVDFKFTNISGQNVIESRRHFEANNDPASWGATRLWSSQTQALLMVWKTDGLFNDDRYRLRVRSWDEAGGVLSNDRVLATCATQNENGIVLRIDNRVVTAGPTDAHGNPCGAGTVHICTDEPDSAILSIGIRRPGVPNLLPVQACGSMQIKDGDNLVVDYIAFDPDGHLASYSLRANYDVNLSNNLLALGTPLPGPAPVSGVPVADHAGPSYVVALASPTIVSPTWRGGVMRLEVPAKDAFPETCCYQLELTVHKRTIVNCSDSYWGHYNRSETSFMISV